MTAIRLDARSNRLPGTGERRDALRHETRMRRPEHGAPCVGAAPCLGTPATALNAGGRGSTAGGLDRSNLGPSRDAVAPRVLLAT